MYGNIPEKNPTQNPEQSIHPIREEKNLLLLCIKSLIGSRIDALTIMFVTPTEDTNNRNKNIIKFN